MRPAPDHDIVPVAGATAAVGAVTVVAASSSDHFASILTFVGALSVAVITAWTAGRRQDRALSDGQETTAAQLRHERVLQERASLREVCDDALGAIDQIRALAVAALYDDRVLLIEDYEVAVAQAARSVNQLQLRFGVDEPICRRYQDLVEAVLVEREAAGDGNRDAYERAAAPTADAHRNFVAQALQRTRYRGDD